MLKRPKQKVMTEAQLQEVLNASAQQTGKATKQRTYDDNYPVFEVPVNQKVFAYVPNHVYTTPDGVTSLAMDKFAAHDCNLKGREFYRIRCTSGIVSEVLGLDGSCPFCDAMTEVWDLVHKEYSNMVLAKGGDPDDDSMRDTYKADYTKAKEGMAVKGGRVFVTFPIVVIECETRNGKVTTTPKKDENGRLIYKIMWYTCSEKIFQEKWEAALETAPSTTEEPPETPAGLWVILNYEYDAEGGQHTKMLSAQKLNVGYKQVSPAYESWAKEFDELTKDWTPQKATEVIVDNVIRDMEEQTIACDEIMKQTRDKLAMFQLQTSVSPVSAKVMLNKSAEATLEDFGNIEALPNKQGTQVAPQAVPQVTPQAVPQAVPQAIPQAVPQAVPQTQATVIPDGDVGVGVSL